MHSVVKNTRMFLNEHECIELLTFIGSYGKDS